MSYRKILLLLEVRFTDVCIYLHMYREMRSRRLYVDQRHTKYSSGLGETFEKTTMRGGPHVGFPNRTITNS